MEPLIDPDEIEQAAFSTRVRGYDPSEVEAFLADVAERLRLEHDAADNAYQTVGEEMGDLLQSARDRADTMIAEAEKEAERIRSMAAEEVGGAKQSALDAVAQLRTDAQEEANRLRAAAQEETAALRSAAEEETAALRRQAEADARGMIEDAERRLREMTEAHEKARDRLALLRLQLIEVTEELQRIEEESARRRPTLDESGGPGSSVDADDLPVDDGLLVDDDLPKVEDNPETPGDEPGDEPFTEDRGPDAVTQQIRP